VISPTAALRAEPGDLRAASSVRGTATDAPDSAIGALPRLDRKSVPLVAIQASA
jgi:hypothetical protein